MARKLDKEEQEKNKQIVACFKYLLPLVKGKLLRNQRVAAAKDAQQEEEFEKILHHLTFYSQDTSPPVSLRRAKEVLDFWELHQSPAFSHWSLKQHGVMAAQSKSMRIFLTNTLN